MEGHESVSEMKKELQDLNENIYLKQKEIANTLKISAECKKDYFFKSQVLSLITDLSKKRSDSKSNQVSTQERFKDYLRNNERKVDDYVCELESIKRRIESKHGSTTHALQQKDMLYKQSEELKLSIISLKKTKSDLEDRSAKEKQKSPKLDQELNTLKAQQKALNEESDRLSKLISSLTDNIIKIPKISQSPQPKILIKKNDSEGLFIPSFAPKTSVRLDKYCSSNAETEDDSISEYYQKSSKTAKLQELKRKKNLLISENESLKKEVQAIKSANISLAVYNESFEQASKDVLIKYFLVSLAVCFILLLNLT
jgi:hypothetical protein